MSQEYKIELDTLDHIPADVLGMTVTKLYVDAFTLGPMADDDGNWKKSKNHWAIILEDRSGSCRLSMESRLNSVTGKQGVLVLKKPGYSQSTATIYRETYTWQWTTVTIRNILLYYIARKWHKFQMHEDSNGAFKGCRHNVYVLLTFRKRIQLTLDSKGNRLDCLR